MPQNWGLFRKSSSDTQTADQANGRSHDDGRVTCFMGIDLGTSRTGYSYAFDCDPAFIKMPPQWRGDRYMEPKTATALLYEVGPDGAWHYLEWGSMAVKRYTTCCNPEEKRRLRLLEGKQFKMALSDDLTGFPAHYKLPKDCPLSPQEIISRMLSCLHEHAVEYLRSSAGVDVTRADMHYCLSVPAGWSPLAKDIMKQAAEDAGMTLRGCADAVGSSNGNGSGSGGKAPAGDASWLDASAVSIVHEQEAAAVTACYDPHKSWGGLRATPGSVWVILDAGGGTVDMAMHKVEASSTPGESQLSEVMESACLPWGSTMLDRQAEEVLIRPLFQSDAHYDRWKAEDPASFLRQMQKWEDAKIEFTGNNDVWLEFINPLTECLPAASPERRQGGMFLDAATMRRKVFDPILAPILQQLKQMVTATRRCDGQSGADVVLMCGGFGSNPYLRSEVEQVCGHCVKKVVSPVDAKKAVVLGNTLHLQRPRSIIARCSRLTYGVRCCSQVQPGCERGGLVMVGPKNKDPICVAHFQPLVVAGEQVLLDQKTAPWRVVPLPGSDSVILEVFATEKAGAVHVTERHMHKVGDIVVEVCKLTRKFAGLTISKQSSADFAIDVYFSFGAAEIHVEVHDVTNNKVVSTKIKFNSEPAKMAATLPSA